MDGGSEAHIPQLHSQRVMDSKRHSQMGDNSKHEDERHWGEAKRIWGFKLEKLECVR